MARCLKDMCSFGFWRGYQAVILESQVSSILPALSQATEMSDVARYNYFIKVIAKLCSISIISNFLLSSFGFFVLKASEVLTILESVSV